MIRFQCPDCRSTLQVNDQLAGQIVACGKCRRHLRVPRGAATPPLIVPRPRTQPRPRSWTPLVVGLALGLLAGLAGGVYLLVDRAGSRPTPVRESTEPAAADTVQTPLVAAKPAAENQAVETPTESLARSLVALLNAQRSQEGVPPVTLDEASCRACREHAAYLQQHLNQSLLDPHSQDFDAGATPAGRNVAPSTSIAPVEPREALRTWLLSPAHRAYLLAPELQSLGLAGVQSVEGKWLSVFNFTSGRATLPAPSASEPVVFPVPRQANVPLVFPGNEVPDPLPQARNKLGGFPITVSFPSDRTVTSARATLENEYGQEVPVWLSSPARPANEAYPRHQGNTIGLIPRSPLRPGTRYVVQIEAEVGGKEWARTWSFTTLPPAEYGHRIYQRAVQRLNHLRAGCGLEALELDADLSAVCLSHANYLALNLDRVDSVHPNDQNDQLPGFTKEGQQLARNSLVRMGGGTGPADALDWVLASVLNRHLVLNPTARRIGLGAMPQSPRGWIWVAHVPPLRRDGEGPRAVLYPSRDQTDIPLTFGREVSELVKDAPPGTIAGFGITANFFPRRKLTSISAQLFDESSREVPCWRSTPDRPLAGVGRYNQILLIPKIPLRSATRYQVRMRADVDGAAWSETWHFTTLDSERLHREMTELVLRQINSVRAVAKLAAVTLDETLSRGCQAHAEYLARNLEHPKAQGLGVHEEDPALPGATKEGAAAGTASVIAVLPDPRDAVDGWIATLYHRIPLLDPRVKRIGFGLAQHPSRGWAVVVDSSRGR